MVLKPVICLRGLNALNVAENSNWIKDLSRKRNKMVKALGSQGVLIGSLKNRMLLVLRHFKG
jgi:hypothetical protein